MAREALEAYDQGMTVPSANLKTQTQVCSKEAAPDSMVTAPAAAIEHSNGAEQFVVLDELEVKESSLGQRSQRFADSQSLRREGPSRNSSPASSSTYTPRDTWIEPHMP